MFNSTFQEASSAGQRQAPIDQTHNSVWAHQNIITSTTQIARTHQQSKEAQGEFRHDAHKAQLDSKRKFPQTMESRWWVQRSRLPKPLAQSGPSIRLWTAQGHNLLGNDGRYRGTLDDKWWCCGDLSGAFCRWHGVNCCSPPQGEFARRLQVPHSPRVPFLNIVQMFQCDQLGWISIVSIGIHLQQPRACRIHWQQLVGHNLIFDEFRGQKADDDHQGWEVEGRGLWTFHFKNTIWNESGHAQSYDGYKTKVACIDFQLIMVFTPARRPKKGHGFGSIANPFA